MTMAFNYETFVRSAFGQPKGEMLDRWGDPAGFANTDLFNNENLAELKVTIGYSMLIFKSEIINNITITDECIFDSFINNVLNAVNITELDELINKFRTNVIDKCYNRDNGLHLKRITSATLVY